MSKPELQQQVSDARKRRQQLHKEKREIRYTRKRLPYDDPQRLELKDQLNRKKAEIIKVNQEIKALDRQINKSSAAAA